MQLKRLPGLRSPAGVGAAAALFCLVAGCNTIDNGLDNSVSRDQHDPINAVRNIDVRAQPGMSADAGDGRVAKTSGPWIYPGEEREPPLGDSRIRGGGVQLASNDPGAIVGVNGVELNFENVDIPTVAKAILGDVLGLDYVIDPRAQGTVTLVSVGPIPRGEVLMVFESALHASNAAIVNDGAIYKVVPMSEANGGGPISVGVGQPGYGVSVVPLRYVSATTMAKLAENFLSRPGALRADPAGNVVMIQGTTVEREGALDMIQSFDVEWLRNQSVGVYPLKATTPDQMIHELQPIFQNVDGGWGAGVIQIEPVPRMNAVIAVAKSPKVLEQATRWIERLDRSDENGTALRTYRLKYDDALQTVSILNSIFATQSPTAGGTIAPGAGTSEARLDSLGTSNFGGANGTGNGTSNSLSTGSGTTGIGMNQGQGFGQGQGLGQSQGLGQGQGQTQGLGQGATMQAAFSAFSDNKEGSGTDSGSAGQTNSNGARGLLPNVRISADVPNNAVVVYSNAQDYRTIERALQQLDQPRLQVAIDATVAEVDLTDQLQWGVQYFLQSGNAGSVGLLPAPPTSSSSPSSTSTTTSTVASAAASLVSPLLSQVAPGFNLLLGSQTNPGAILTALSTLTNVKVLSSPAVVVLDNRPAILEVGDIIPITTGTATVLTSGAPIVNTIQMQNTGVILKVLPHVHPNGSIQLEIDQEISNVENPGQQTLTPTISDRHIHTTVVVGSSQTVLLGGLISDQNQSTKAGIPGLLNVQFLGALFGNTSTNKQRTEIIVFIRPRIIRDAVDAQAVAEEFRDSLELMRRTTPVTSSPMAASRTK